MSIPVNLWVSSPPPFVTLVTNKPEKDKPNQPLEVIFNHSRNQHCPNFSKSKFINLKNRKEKKALIAAHKAEPGQNTQNGSSQTTSALIY